MEINICPVCKQKMVSKVKDELAKQDVEKKQGKKSEGKQEKKLGGKQEKKSEGKTLVLETDLSNWNIKSPSKRVSANGQRVKVHIPKNQFSARGGVNEKFIPEGIRPASKVEFEYQLRVPSDFDFVKGGKIGLGFNINDGCGGKDWGNDARRQRNGSFRLMFRANGLIVAYIYLCTDQGQYKEDDLSCPLLRNQGEEFIEAIGRRAPGAGLDVFRHTKEKLFLEPGKWNTIKMGATLNSRPKSNDGSLYLEINGKRLETSGVCWTSNPEKNRFNQLQLPMWMGGSNQSWASPKDQWVKVRKIKYHMLDA
jgi:hypothetical protein